MINIPLLLIQTSIYQMNGEDGFEGICYYLLVLILILVILYVGLYLYQHFIGSKKTVQHICNYCGRMVDAVSDCCHAPVEERFLYGKCRSCGKKCTVVCKNCKRKFF